MRLDTWIGNELVTVETDDIWAQTFAYWDCLVDTDTAAKIASAVVNTLEDTFTGDGTRED